MDLKVTHKSVFANDNGEYTGVIIANDVNMLTSKFSFEFACGTGDESTAMIDLDAQFNPIKTALQAI